MSKIFVLGNLAESLVNFRKPFLQTLVAAGYDVVVCAPESTSEIREKITSLGVLFVSLPLSRAGLNPFADLTYVYRLIRLLRRYAPDICFTYTIKPNIYGNFAAFLAGVRFRYAMVTGVGYVFTEGQGLKRRLVRYITQSLYKVAFKHVDAVVFQNENDEELFLSRGICTPATKTFIVNGSGVDINHYKQSDLVKVPFRFLMIARLLKDKGVLEYCEAARQVKRIYKNVRFALAGPVDPNPTAIPLQYIQDWDEEGVGKYLGEIKDVRPILTECTVYVLPSYREGTPRTVLEAMATGRPVITTDAPGCRETVKEGFNGLKVPIGDVSALANAMIYMIENPSETDNMGKHGREIAEIKYDAYKVARDMMEKLGL